LKVRFDSLNKHMRVFETSSDRIVADSIHMVVRLDGRGFSKLTNEVLKFKRPFDSRFKDAMVHTARHLMLNTGIQPIYAYTQSDEISLLLHRDERAFGRKTRKLNSILSGEASAAISLHLNQHACFDSRVCELPSSEQVVDYFRWRCEDATRNAANAYSYWRLREEGCSPAEADRQLSGLNVSDKLALLINNGVELDTFPQWQQYGVGLVWRQEEKKGINPITGQTVSTTRKHLFVDNTLPTGDSYGNFIDSILVGKTQY